VSARNHLARVIAMISSFVNRLLFGVVLLAVTCAIYEVPGAYRDLRLRARLGTIVRESQPVRAQLTRYEKAHGRLPQSLEAAGIESRLANGSKLSLDIRRATLTIQTGSGELVFLLHTDLQGHRVWTCVNGEGVTRVQLPTACREDTSGLWTPCGGSQLGAHLLPGVRSETSGP